jgi:site-specific recombinase XerD
LSLVHAADTAPGAQRARTAALVAVLLLTGARVSEVIGADVEDLGSEHGRRILWVTRGDGQRRRLTLPAPAAARIDAYLAERDGQARRPHRAPAEPRALFATASGNRLFAADVWRIVRRLAARAGLPDELACHLGPEAMRHSFATLYLDAGGSLGDLQRDMGHADPRTTRRYDRTRRTPNRSPGDVVAAYLASRRPAQHHDPHTSQNRPRS